MDHKEEIDVYIQISFFLFFFKWVKRKSERSLTGLHRFAGDVQRVREHVAEPWHRIQRKNKTPD